MVDRIERTLALIITGLWAAACFWSAPSLRGQDQMPDSNALSKWRPHGASDISYLGSGSCARCHTHESATQAATPMAKALSLVADCQILSSYPRLTFRNGSYSYQIVRQGNRNIYTVADGVNAISEPLLYCFGVGKVGQTYVFKHNGVFYETRVSFYQATQNLDFTTGHPRSAATSLEEALGRPLSLDEAQACFGCHSTAAVAGSQLQLDHLIPGVSCEACHGPGEKHIAAVKAHKFKELQIFNPAKMDAEGLTQEFCGSCHRSFDQVMVMPRQAGLNNIRFQPYRIFNSRGHKGDPRISCVACHDPHDRLERDAAFYDSKCLVCHLVESGDAKAPGRTAAACPVSKQQCANCHMPKVELPEMHFKFTDHWIRIAKPNGPVPN
jgi:hypothetical protein